jgi:hypothetical protein
MTSQNQGKANDMKLNTPKPQSTLGIGATYQESKNANNAGIEITLQIMVTGTRSI